MTGLDHVEYVTILQKIRELLPQPSFDFHILPFRESARMTRTTRHNDNYLCGPFTPSHMRDVRFYFNIVIEKRAPEASSAQLLIQDDTDWAFLDVREVYDHTLGQFVPIPQETLMFNMHSEPEQLRGAEDMQEGQWYEVTYLVPGLHRKPHDFVAQYIGTRDWGGHIECVFSFRPLAGTSEVRRDYISKIKSPRRTEPRRPEIAR
jgi:hypothetical protein